MSTKLDTRQSLNRVALPMVGSAINDTLDSILVKVDPELSKLFEDRNSILVDGGSIAVNAAATSVTFTASLKLHINSLVAGGAPKIVDLAATTRAFTANGNMLYAVVNRTAGTAVVTADASTLPVVTSANQEVFLIAKRIGTIIIFRDGTAINASQSSRLGMSSGLDNSFSIGDAADPTKQIAFDAAGTTATKTTILSSQTVDRTLTLPDATDTIVARNTTDTLTNKRVQYSVATDSTTTGSNATLAAITTGVVRLTNGSLLNVSGIPSAGIGGGMIVVIENKTGNLISINNDEATASAADRIFTGTGANITMPNNSTFVFVYDATSSRWMLASGSGSGGGGGGKNYLSAVTTSQSTTPNTGNGNFELGSTTGWALGTTGTLTNGIPTGSPTFGSGASGNLSIAAVTSGRLAGSYSLSYASSAATTAGNMLHSDAFNIDTEDQSKVLAFKFYYSPTVNPTNGNYSGSSSNSFGIAAYDVTNSAWLPVNGNFAMTQSSGVGIASGTFQTSTNTASIRFVVYNANATAGATTLLFDDFSVGPQIIVQGSPINDWTAFTPTLTNFTTSTTNARWRRIGDSMEVRYFFAVNSVTGTIYFTLPSGYTVDGSKMDLTANEGHVGTATANDSGPAANYHGHVQPANTSNMFRVVNSGGGNEWGTTIPFTWGVGDRFSAVIMVPIVGWSSNVEMSSDTDTRVVASKYSTSSTLVFGNGTYSSAFNYNTKSFDTHAAVSSGVFTVPVSGIYRVSAAFRTAAYAGVIGRPVKLGLFKNGSLVSAVCQAILMTSSSTTIAAAGSTTVSCSAGDTLDIRGYADDAPVNSDADGTDNYFSVERLSGPSVIAANEIICAKYNSTTTSVTTSGPTIVYTTKVFDTHGVYNTSTGVFTAPATGKYRMQFFWSASTSPTGTVNTTTLAAVKKNGVQTNIVCLFTRQITGALTPTVWGSDIENLVPGDTLELTITRDAGDSANFASSGSANSWITFERI